ncbi:MAG TPA: cyclic nucleotide-binding domain-containing protein [Chthoniobacter sp.]|jgi:CRP-like cAMP-binding protein
MTSSDPNPQSGFALLNELSDDEIGWLRKEGERRFCDRGTVLVKEGARIEALYMVLTGVITVTVGGVGGREIAKLGPGQIIGEMSFLEDHPASATVRAVECSEVLALPRAKIESKLGEDPAFSSHWYRGLAIVASRRLRDSVGQLSRLLESEPMAENQALARWGEVARRTQEFKTRLVALSKSPRAAQTGNELIEPLTDFSATLDRAIGPDSLETLDARESLGARVQRELLPFFLKACTPLQLYEKPRGYPADFRAVEMIHAHKPDGEGALGPLLDEAFLALPSMAAIRSSRKLIQDALRQVVDSSATKPVRITSVGAAPAVELRGIAAARPSDVEGTLLEFDDEALDWVRTIRGGARLRLELESLVNLALGFRRVDVDGQDFVYSLLVSSFSDRFAVGVLNYLHGLLRPGGWACIGSLHPRNPDKSFFAHVLGWDIVHRDEDAMNNLFERSAFGRKCARFTSEEKSIFYLAACQKS